eukprot:TRINITY_DN29559_c0_g1_i1.p1 TRINITY_DN29559_c0_g1~~TRINITY_DN29559_c0_g1_i1.p1  ORF type:complete len:118 (-),score=8.07 TRINITY_DN29559_c0_g1_i1:454-807(-)
MTHDITPNPLSMSFITNTSLLPAQTEAFDQQETPLSCLIANTCYVVNVSNSLSFTLPILGVFYPILTLLTTVANSIIIHILLRPAMRSPTTFCWLLLLCLTWLLCLSKHRGMFMYTP